MVNSYIIHYKESRAVCIGMATPLIWNIYAAHFGKLTLLGRNLQLYDTLERTRKVARATANVTHNHPEGIKGAESVATVIFLARTGSSKEQIRKYVTEEFGYDLSRTCDEIRPNYHHVESCQETVPEAITAFLEGNDFEDVIRTAVSLGGDCDTLTAIAGSMAEAFYGIPALLTAECRARVPEDMLNVLNCFDEALGRGCGAEEEPCISASTWLVASRKWQES